MDPFVPNPMVNELKGYILYTKEAMPSCYHIGVPEGQYLNSPALTYRAILYYLSLQDFIFFVGSGS